MVAYVPGILYSCLNFESQVKISRDRGRQEDKVITRIVIEDNEQVRFTYNR
jgi:hypothetical protein